MLHLGLNSQGPIVKGSLTNQSSYVSFDRMKTGRSVESGPGVVPKGAGRLDHEVDAVEPRIGHRVVPASVRPARFVPFERRGCDQPGERVRIAEQFAQSRLVAARPGAYRQTASRVAAVGGSNRKSGGRRLALRFACRRCGGARTEDEAFT